MTQESPITARLRELRERFAAELPDRIAAIEAARQAAMAGGVEAANAVYRLVHTMAGSAGTFGYEALGARARLLERLLKAPAREWSAMDADVGRAVADFRTLVAAGPDTAVKQLPQSQVDADAGRDPETPIRVYVLEDDALQGDEIVAQLRHFSYEARSFTSATALAAAAAKAPPDALVADIILPEGPLAGPATVAKLAQQLGKVPVIFISVRGDWQARFYAVRAGGDAYITKPVDMSLLLEQLDRLTGRRELIVEDQPTLAEHYAAVLRAAGMAVEVLQNPQTLLDTLAAFQPDLILMDVFMPDCMGPEAAQVVRQHPSWWNLPIVYLSAQDDIYEQLAALRVGGDDFLTKPIENDHLVAAVSIRAERFRSFKALMTRDGLTGLLNHINLKLALEREISLARRRDRPLSVVMLDIDHFKAVNDTYGHPVGDRVLKALARMFGQRLRTTDVAARYGGEEFALILPDTDGPAAAMVLDNLRERFGQVVHSDGQREFSVNFSAGIACAPPMGAVDELLGRADRALYAAKAAGRNRVELHAGDSEPTAD